MISNDLPDAPATANPDPAEPPRVKGPAEMPRYRVRVRFSKTGLLRFISHNDLMRLWDRMLRRTGLPLRSTEGFHAKTRLSSPLSLAVGFEAADEIIDLEFTRACSADEVAELLRGQLPEGLGIVSASVLTTAEARQAVTQVEYHCAYAEEFSLRDVEAKARELLSSTSWFVCRRAPGKPDRRVDIRPYIDNIAATEKSITILLHVQAGTTARPEEVLEALGWEGARRDARWAVTRSRVILGPRPKPTDPPAAHGERAVRTES
jgi:radical SAM-linked protein